MCCRRRGFVLPQPHKRPRSSWRRFVADLPNEVWQVDITHWLLANGREVEILNIEDDHSRLLVGSTARTVFKAGDIVTDLHAAIARYGRPERLLTDNGAVFTGAYRGHGWVALESGWPSKTVDLWRQYSRSSDRSRRLRSLMTTGPKKPEGMAENGSGYGTDGMERA